MLSNLHTVERRFAAIDADECFGAGGNLNCLLSDLAADGDAAIQAAASLINLLNNEIKPILDATNETIATLRGTSQFLSENLVAPVVKLNSYLAGLQKMFEMIGMKKK